jgi:threonine dehydrogenase-like Zn-dependent dehydrogenase
MVPLNLMNDMRVPYMQGDFTFPCTYGYSLVGEIIEGTAEHIGKKVHLMHPHQSYAVTAINDTNFIPGGIPLKTATLVSNIETALTGVWDSRVSIGDDVLLVGFGSIGSLLARLLFNYPNVQLTIIEKEDHRLRKARELGYNAIKDDKNLDRSYDIAFNCSGSQEGLQLCIDRLTYEGRVVEMSWYGNQQVSLHLGQEFHIKRNQIISSQVSNIPGRKMNKWDLIRRKKLVFDILKDPYYQKIIDEEVLFRETPLIFKRIRNNELKSLGILIRY